MTPGARRPVLALGHRSSVPGNIGQQIEISRRGPRRSTRGPLIELQGAAGGTRIASPVSEHIPRRSRVTMKFRLLGSAVGVLVAATIAGQAHAQEAPPLRLDLNIPALRLAVYEHGERIKTYGVAVGKRGHDTPMGEYTLDHAEWNPWWRPPPGREWTRGKQDTPPGPDNPMGRVKLFFAPLYFIHGTPEAESIGSPASHGCVRMRNSDVVELARLVHRHAAPNVTSQAIDRILAQSRTTRTIRFQDPVELVIRYDPIVVEDGALKIYPDIYGYNRIHVEGVYQALLAAGYDVDAIERRQVSELLARVARERGTFSAAVAELFPSAVLAAAR
jgi:lipoprotein-anchoring transpeptidase ErfK/SrfK